MSGAHSRTDGITDQPDAYARANIDEIYADISTAINAYDGQPLTDELYGEIRQAIVRVLMLYGVNRYRVRCDHLNNPDYQISHGYVQADVSLFSDDVWRTRVSHVKVRQ